MTNEVEKTNNIALDSDGNAIISEQEDGGGKNKTIKYGLIKLIGEKQERRVSMKTIIDINNAKEHNFTGQINIPELNMSVSVSQIIMMRSETETIRTVANIANLPTTNLILTEQFQISGNLRNYFVRNRIPYYEAVVHYSIRDGERQYYLDSDKIKRLVKVDFDDDGYDYITAIYYYGVKQ